MFNNLLSFNFIPLDDPNNETYSLSSDSEANAASNGDVKPLLGWYSEKKMFSHNLFSFFQSFYEIAFKWLELLSKSM